MDLSPDSVGLLVDSIRRKRGASYNASGGGGPVGTSSMSKKPIVKQRVLSPSFLSLSLLPLAFLSLTLSTQNYLCSFYPGIGPYPLYIPIFQLFVGKPASYHSFSCLRMPCYTFLSLESFVKASIQQYNGYLCGQIIVVGSFSSLLS